MNRRQRIIISVISIVLVLLIIVGLTYAYFLTQIKGNTNNKSVSVTTADLKLVYGDGNGLVIVTNAIPGSSLTGNDGKTFTVTNDGNATVNNYAVYLEDVVNEFERSGDVVYTLTCTSSIVNKTCNGVSETEFPKENGYIVTNNIDIGETQTYRLDITYKEMNVDQSVDMNKELSTKIQIYALQDIVDIRGTVTGYSSGDYVEMHSNPKISQIDEDGKFLIPAVEPGTHTIYLKNEEGNTLASENIVINKRSTASVINKTTVNVENDSQTVATNIIYTVGNNSLDINVAGVEEFIDSNKLLKNVIIAKAQANLEVVDSEINGFAVYREKPLTTPANTVNINKYYKTPNIAKSESSMTVSTEYQDYYWTYGTGYTLSETTGKFCLTGVSTCKYNDGTCNETLVGKYLGRYDPYYNTKSTNTENIMASCSTENVYLVTEAPESSSTNIKIKYITHSAVSYSFENELSATEDDYGTSYYYRGDPKDNFINFAGMCWRIVRIEGDGSVKIILEDSSHTCEDNSFTGNYTDGRKVVFGYDSNNKADFLNNSQGIIDGKLGLAESLETFQNNKLSGVLDKLKLGGFCYDYNVSDLTNTNDDILYETYKRVTNKTPSLKCNGYRMTEFKDGVGMYVGALVSDELLFAGSLTSGFGEYKNSHIYLRNNKAKKIYAWLTISPAYYYKFLEDDEVYFFPWVDGRFSASRGCNYNLYNSVDGYSRPAVILKSTTQISEGDGTQSNPYIIK